MTCRKRKLKCDEGRPTCGQCLKASRMCEPSTGITFRHQHNASLNAHGGGSPGQQNQLNSFYNYRESFGSDTIWATLPKGDCRFRVRMSKGDVANRLSQSRFIIFRTRTRILSSLYPLIRGPTWLTVRIRTSIHRIHMGNTLPLICSQTHRCLIPTACMPSPKLSNCTRLRKRTCYPSLVQIMTVLSTTLLVLYHRVPGHLLPTLRPLWLRPIVPSIFPHRWILQ